MQDNIDYIVSTISCEIPAVPVIHVDSFINQRSRQRLNRVISDLREQRVMKVATDGRSLADLLPERHIIIDKQPLSIESAITMAVQPLINDGIVYSNYVTTILKQFGQFGSYMVISPYIVLIHAGTDYVQSGVGFALAYFTKGITFDSKANDPVHLVITLTTDHPDAHLKASGQLNECLSNGLYRQDLLDGNIFKIKQHIALTTTKEA